jgi:anti-anti-sigma factor
MLTINVEKTGDVAIVRCVGRIVRGAELRTLRDAVFVEQYIRIVVIDLSDVGMLDAGGLTALLSLLQWARTRNVQLKLVNPSHFVNEVLTRTGLDHVFEISTFEHALFVLSAPDSRHSRYAAVC